MGDTQVDGGSFDEKSHVKHKTVRANVENTKFPLVCRDLNGPPRSERINAPINL